MLNLNIGEVYYNLTASCSQNLTWLTLQLEFYIFPLSFSFTNIINEIEFVNNSLCFLIIDITLKS